MNVKNEITINLVRGGKEGYSTTKRFPARSVTDFAFKREESGRWYAVENGKKTVLDFEHFNPMFDEGKSLVDAEVYGLYAEQQGLISELLEHYQRKKALVDEEHSIVLSQTIAEWQKTTSATAAEKIARGDTAVAALKRESDTLEAVCRKLERDYFQAERNTRAMAKMLGYFQ